MQSDSELRVGGAWTIRFGPSREQLYRHRHVFIAIDRPRRLQLSTTETRLDGTTLRHETELRFQAVDGGTLMTMTQPGLPTEQLRTEHSRGVPHDSSKTSTTQPTTRPDARTASPARPQPEQASAADPRSGGPSP